MAVLQNVCFQNGRFPQWPFPRMVFPKMTVPKMAVSHNGRFPRNSEFCIVEDNKYKINRNVGAIII